MNGRGKVLPRLTPLGLRLLIAACLVAVTVSGCLLGPAHGQEIERYQPASRGVRFESLAVQRWRPLVEQYDWPVETALRVLTCESEGNPGVWNREGSGAHGLFQLLGWEWKAFELYGVWDVGDPAVNVGVAYWIWRASGRRFDASMGWLSSAGCWR